MTEFDTLALMAVVFGGVATIFTAAMVYARNLKFRERQLELTASHTAEKAAQYAAHTERLEARVRVLERIATDKGQELAGAIEDLRDPAVN